VGSGLLDRDEALAALQEAVWANGLRSAGIKTHSFDKGLAAAADDPVIPRREHATEQEFVPVGAHSHNNPPTTTELREGDLGQSPGQPVMASLLAHELRSTARLACERRFYALFQTATNSFLSGHISCDTRSCVGCQNRLLMNIAETIANAHRPDDEVYGYENISDGAWSRIRKAIGRRGGGYLRIPLANGRQTVWSDIGDRGAIAMDLETFEHDLAEAWKTLTPDVAGHVRLEGRWKRRVRTPADTLSFIAQVSPTALASAVEHLKGSSQPTETGWLKTSVPPGAEDDLVRMMQPPAADGSWLKPTA